MQKEMGELSGAPELVWVSVEGGHESRTGPAHYRSRCSEIGRRTVTRTRKHSGRNFGLCKGHLVAYSETYRYPIMHVHSLVARKQKNIDAANE